MAHTHKNTGGWAFTGVLAALTISIGVQVFPLGVTLLLTAAAIVGSLAFARLVERTPWMQTKRFAALLVVLLVLATGVFLALVFTGSSEASTGGVQAPSGEAKVVRDLSRFRTSQTFVIRRHLRHNGKVQHRRFCVRPGSCTIVRIQQVVPREARKALAGKRTGGTRARAAWAGYPYLYDLYGIAASRYVNDNMYRLLRGNFPSVTTAYEWPDGGPRQFGSQDDNSGAYQEDRQFPGNGLSWVHFDNWVAGFNGNVMVEVQWVSLTGQSEEPTYLTIGSPGLQLVAELMPDLFEHSA
jgi:hypothetical protein